MSDEYEIVHKHHDDGHDHPDRREPGDVALVIVRLAGADQFARPIYAYEVQFTPKDPALQLRLLGSIYDFLPEAATALVQELIEKRKAAGQPLMDTLTKPAGKPNPVTALPEVVAPPKTEKPN